MSTDEQIRENVSQNRIRNVERTTRDYERWQKQDPELAERMDELLQSDRVPWEPTPWGWNKEDWDWFQAGKYVRAKVTSQKQREEARQREEAAEQAREQYRQQVEEWRETPEGKHAEELRAASIPVCFVEGDGMKASQNAEMPPDGGGIAIELGKKISALKIAQGGENTLAKLGITEFGDTATLCVSSTAYKLFKTGPGSPEGLDEGRIMGPGLEWMTRGTLPTPDGDRAYWETKPDRGIARPPQEIAKAEPIYENEDEFSHGPAKRVDLAAVIQRGVEPAEYLYPDLVYEGKIHAFQAEPHVGKTYAAAAVALYVANSGGRVMWFDEENDRLEIASILYEMGATSEDLQRIPYYNAGYTLEEAAGFYNLVNAVQPSLVIWDNMASVLRAAGLSESDNDDVTDWYNAFPKPLRGLNVASLILDHMTKANDGALYARGAGAKRAENQVMWTLKKPENFNRRKVGKMKFQLVKDKPALMPADNLFFEAGGTPPRFVRPDNGSLTANQRKTLDALKDGATAQDWRDAAIAAGVSQSSVYRIKNDLTDKLKLVEEKGGCFYRT